MSGAPGVPTDEGAGGPVEVVAGIVVVRVHVQPRASRAGITGRHGDSVKVAVTAAPVGGRANEAVADVLAAAFGVNRRAVELRTGAQSREKRFAVAGITPAEARRILLASGALSLDGPHR